MEWNRLNWNRLQLNAVHNLLHSNLFFSNLFHSNPLHSNLFYSELSNPFNSIGRGPNFRGVSNPPLLPSLPLQPATRQTLTLGCNQLDPPTHNQRATLARVFYTDEQYIMHECCLLTAQRAILRLFIMARSRRHGNNVAWTEAIKEIMHWIPYVSGLGKITKEIVYAFPNVVEESKLIARTVGWRYINLHLRLRLVFCNRYLGIHLLD